MAEIYLLRHGEAVHKIESEHVIGGRSSEAELTCLGVQQAFRAGEWLNANVSLQYFACSTAIRATQTLDSALKAMGQPNAAFESFADFEEMTQGPADGKLRKTIYTPEVTELRRLRDLDFTVPGGETPREVGVTGLKRVLHIARQNPEDATLIVGHGFKIRALVGQILGWSLADIVSAKTPNASLTHLTISNEDIRVNCIGKDIAKTS